MVPLTDEHHGLAAAVRARTVLAACHHVEVAGGTAGERRPATGLVACGADLYLVTEADEVGEGPVVIVGRCAVAGLGVLKVVGRCGPAVPPARAPEVQRLLDGRHDGAAVVPVAVEEVRLLVPATRSRRAHVVPVDLDEFRSARPDPWVVGGDSLGRHLEECHQDELATLAAGRLGVRPEAVVVRGVGRTQLRLGCLFADGVADVSLAYDRPVAHPAELGAWLRGLVRPGE